MMKTIKKKKKKPIAFSVKLLIGKQIGAIFSKLFNDLRTELNKGPFTYHESGKKKLTSWHEEGGGVRFERQLIVNQS